MQLDGLLDTGVNADDGQDNRTEEEQEQADLDLPVLVGPVAPALDAVLPRLHTRLPGAVAVDGVPLDPEREEEDGRERGGELENAGSANDCDQRGDGGDRASDDPGKRPVRNDGQRPNEHALLRVEVGEDVVVKHLDTNVGVSTVATPVEIRPIMFVTRERVVFWKSRLGRMDVHWPCLP